MKESHSLFRESSLREQHSRRGGGSLATNPIRYGKGKAHEVNVTH